MFAIVLMGVNICCCICCWKMIGLSTALEYRRKTGAGFSVHLPDRATQVDGLKKILQLVGINPWHKMMRREVIGYGKVVRRSTMGIELVGEGFERVGLVRQMFAFGREEDVNLSRCDLTSGYFRTLSSLI